MKADLGIGERTAKAKLGGIERDRHDKDSVDLNRCAARYSTQRFGAVNGGRGSRSLYDALERPL